MKRSRLRQHHARFLAEINVVPYIDVTLVLLLIFMITVPLLEQGIPLDLPKSEALPSSAAPLSEAWVLKVIASNDLHLLRPESPAQTFSKKEDLEKALQEALLAETQSPIVRLKGTAALYYQEVITIMALLQNLGLQKIQLQTQVIPDK